MRPTNRQGKPTKDRFNQAIDNQIKRVELELQELRKQYKEAKLNNDDGAPVVKGIKIRMEQQENVLKTLKEAGDSKSRSGRGVFPY